MAMGCRVKPGDDFHGWILMLRALFIGAFFIAATPPLISLQWLLGKLGLPGWGFIACNYYRVLRALLRIRVRIEGEPVRGRPALFIANHVSWVDIVIIGSITPVAFVAKREVASWPLIGITTKMQRTVFVDRARRQQAGDAAGEIVARLKSGTAVVLFAEGTSSDGNRVLPFRSALFGAVRQAAAAGIPLQPLSIGYTGQHGIAMGRQNRPLVAWYGDLDFLPHIRAFIARGAVNAVVSYASPLAADAVSDRKGLAKIMESKVRARAAAILRGRPSAGPAPDRS
jgi:lyso-ornithine lipid O-acyltransferase